MQECRKRLKRCSYDGALEFFGWEPKVTLAMELPAARGAESRVGAGRLMTMELNPLVELARRRSGDCRAAAAQAPLLAQVGACIALLGDEARHAGEHP